MDKHYKNVDSVMNKHKNEFKHNTDCYDAEIIDKISNDSKLKKCFTYVR